MTESTNILIVGNGFDLSHFLPTKYEHFMSAMQEIEKWDIKKGDMCFDEIFKLVNNDFIYKTKEYYLTENILLNKDEILNIKDLLSNNGWYKYFCHHLLKVDTWIDFEKHIEYLLIDFASFANIANKLSSEGKTDFNLLSKDSPLNKKMKIYKNLDHFNTFSVIKNGIGPTVKLNSDLCYSGNLDNGFNLSNFLSVLQTSLDKIIFCLNFYLDKIIRKLESKNKITITSNSFSKFDKVFSFNYTNTYERFYDEQAKIEYLHGKSGSNQNIVLGVSDLDDEALKKIKAYGFTKYHQKLFKYTDYLFLDTFKKRIANNNIKIQNLENKKKGENRSPHRDALTKEISKCEKQSSLNLQFYVWGHSLDESDKDYILDLFSLNDDIDRNVRVIVYYFNDAAKFDLLNNLLHILDKAKVEQWMKNKWLQFEPNPKITFN